MIFSMYIDNEPFHDDVLPNLCRVFYEKENIKTI